MATYAASTGRPGPIGGTGARGYNPIFGGVPNLPTATGTQTNVSNILNQAIPGFSGLTQSATTRIDDLMNGRLPQSVINEIQDAGAAQAVAGGMPGNSRDFGGVFGNSVLRNIGSAAEGRKQQGFQDLLALLQGYSGTAALTPEQTQDQENARAIYASAPIPGYAIPYMQNQYQQASRPSGGTTISSGGGSNSGMPWWMQGGTEFRRPGAAGGGAGSGAWNRIY
jgi:hypothetical protein